MHASFAVHRIHRSPPLAYEIDSNLVNQAKISKVETIDVSLVLASALKVSQLVELAAGVSPFGAHFECPPTSIDEPAHALAQSRINRISIDSNLKFPPAEWNKPAR